MMRMDVGRRQLWLDDLPAALDTLRSAESITAALAAADPSNVQARWLHGLELNLIGVALREMRRHSEAVAAHQKAASLLERVAGDDGSNESYRYAVANTYQLIGEAYAAAASRAPSHRQRQAWSDAHRWYRRSADAFEAMRARGTLTGAIIKDAEIVAAGLARSERALRAAGRRDAAGAGVSPAARR
jgi:hypothetical protein